jgi:hypothetical protein
MNEVEEYLLKVCNKERDVMLFLHDLFTDKYLLSPKIKYGIPFYFGKKWVCYLNPVKNGGVDLTFLRGFKMEGYDHVLEARGRKMVKSLPILDLEGLDIDLVNKLMTLAIQIDKQ